jgi:hypothetical protein
MMNIVKLSLIWLCNWLKILYYDSKKNYNSNVLAHALVGDLYVGK